VTPRVNILPAAERDIDSQAGYLLREAGLEVALRLYDAANATFDAPARTRGMGFDLTLQSSRYTSSMGTETGTRRVLS
jgi:plasmid stabilization system protein ParE